MTALAAARETAKQDGVLSYGQVLASTKIYKGAAVFKKMSGSNAGYVFSPDGSTNTLAAGDLFVGIAYETIDNSSGANGALTIRIEKSGLFLLPFSDTMTQAKEGLPVYVNSTTADNTFTITSANAGVVQAVVGTVEQFSTSSACYVRIDNYVDTFVSSQGAVNADPTAAGLSTVKVAKFTYDFAVLGGAVSTIALTGAKLPASAIVIDGVIDVITPLTSGGAATVGAQLEAAGDVIASATAYSAAPVHTAGPNDIVPDGTAAKMIKITTAKVASIVIGVAALTAGKFNVYVRYVNG